MANTKITSRVIADNAITTAAIADDAITSATIADDAVVTASIADDAITSALVADNAIGIPALAVSDGSNGQFLKTNGSGTLSFATVSGTTINNNADNRIITGSGTANTLNGESGLTYDGSTLAVTGDANFDSNTLFVDASANAVGIGTANPAALLELSTTFSVAKPDALRISAAGYAGYNWDMWRDNVTGHFNLGSASGGSSTTHMTVKENGNVGIATTDPDNKLHIYNDSGGFNNHLILENPNNSSIYSRGSNIAFQVSNGSAIKDAAIIKGGRQSTTSGGYLYFETADSSWNTPAERMRILSSGGITFNGDSAAANALDDYEEGTWTAGFTESTNTHTGYYTKVGNLVHVAVYGNGVTVGASGVAVITGLPFTVRNTFAAVSLTYNTYSNNAGGAGYFRQNNTTVQLINENNTTQALTNVGSTKKIMMTGTYQTDT